MEAFCYALTELGMKIDLDVPDLIASGEGPEEARLESAQREINLFFRPEEILSYDRSADPWITEP